MKHEYYVEIFVENYFNKKKVFENNLLDFQFNFVSVNYFIILNMSFINLLRNLNGKLNK